MKRGRFAVISAAAFGMALAAAIALHDTAATAKPPAPPPPPPPPGTIYFTNYLANGAAFENRTNADGSGYAVALTLNDPLFGPNVFYSPGIYGSRTDAVPSSRIYADSRWWLAAVDVNGVPDALHHEIYAFRTLNDGSLDRVQLTAFGPDSYALFPQWSNDGADTFFSCIRYSGLDAWLYRVPLAAADIVTANAANLLPLTLAGPTQLLPPNASPVTWAPSGDRYAYISRSNGYEIRIQTIGGADSAVLALGAAGGMIRAVKWSPDGSRIAYIVNPKQKNGLFSTIGSVRTIKPDGTGDKEIVADSNSGTQHYLFPIWSPDSQSLALRDDRSNGSNLVRVPAGGGSVTTILSLGSWMGMPVSWVPNTLAQ